MNSNCTFAPQKTNNRSFGFSMVKIDKVMVEMVTKLYLHRFKYLKPTGFINLLQVKKWDEIPNTYINWYVKIAFMCPAFVIYRHFELHIINSCVGYLLKNHWHMILSQIVQFFLKKFLFIIIIAQHACALYVSITSHQKKIVLKKKLWTIVIFFVSSIPIVPY